FALCRERCFERRTVHSHQPPRDPPRLRPCPSSAPTDSRASGFPTHQAWDASGARTRRRAPQATSPSTRAASRRPPTPTRRYVAVGRAPRAKRVEAIPEERLLATLALLGHP